MTHLCWKRGAGSRVLGRSPDSIEDAGDARMTKDLYALSVIAQACFGGGGSIAVKMLTLLYR